MNESHKQKTEAMREFKSPPVRKKKFLKSKLKSKSENIVLDKNPYSVLADVHNSDDTIVSNTNDNLIKTPNHPCRKHNASRTKMKITKGNKIDDNESDVESVTPTHIIKKGTRNTNNKITEKCSYVNIQHGQIKATDSKKEHTVEINENRNNDRRNSSKTLNGLSKWNEIDKELNEIKIELDNNPLTKTNYNTKGNGKKEIDKVGFKGEMHDCLSLTREYNKIEEEIRVFLKKDKTETVTGKLITIKKDPLLRLIDKLREGKG